MLQTDFGAILCRDGREKHERVICRTEKRAEAVLGVLSCGEFEFAVRIHPSSRFDTANDGERLLDVAMGASPSATSSRHREPEEACSIDPSDGQRPFHTSNCVLQH